MFAFFVEGFDDEQYFKNVFKNSKIIIYQYAQKKKDQVNNFIKSLNCMNADYVFFSDSDGKPDEVKKSELCTTFENLNHEKICIVRFEIESWYLAGISEDYCTKSKIKKYIHLTNCITKEQFDSILPLNRNTRLQIMLDILKEYQLLLAKERNDSLNDFFTKKEELIKAV